MAHVTGVPIRTENTGFLHIVAFIDVIENNKNYVARLLGGDRRIELEMLSRRNGGQSLH